MCHIQPICNTIQIIKKKMIQRNQVMFHTSGIVFLTLVINATTIKFIVQKFKMDQPKPHAKEILLDAMKHLRLSTKLHIMGLKEDYNYAGADWRAVNEALPNYAPILNPNIKVERARTESGELKNTKNNKKICCLISLFFCAGCLFVSIQIYSFVIVCVIFLFFVFCFLFFVFCFFLSRNPQFFRRFSFSRSMYRFEDVGVSDEIVCGCIKLEGTVSQCWWTTKYKIYSLFNCGNQNSSSEESEAIVEEGSTRNTMNSNEKFSLPNAPGRSSGDEKKYGVSIKTPANHTMAHLEKVHKKNKMQVFFSQLQTQCFF